MEVGFVGKEVGRVEGLLVGCEVGCFDGIEVGFVGFDDGWLEG